MLKKKDTQTETNVKKKSFYKKWWFWLIVVVIIIACAAAGTGNNDNQNSSVSNSSDQTESTESQKAENENSKDIIKTLKDTFYKSDPNDVDNLEIKYNKDKDCYVIRYIPAEKYIDDDDFVRQNFSDYIDFCKLAYDIDSVNSIRAEMQCNMTDSEGNSEMTDVIYLESTKKDFQAIDWASYEMKPIYVPLSECCSELYIDTGIWGNLEYQNIWYDAM